MDIEFRSKTLSDTLLNPRACQKELGDLAKPTLKRLAQLRAFVSVQELFISGLDNPEFIKGDGFAVISWHINANYRLEIDLGIPPSDDLTAKLKTITKVYVKGIRDYHGSNKDKPYRLR
jgi:plasmid maintenance system killer protein